MRTGELAVECKSRRRFRVLLFEPHVTGHHGPYLNWMVRGLAKRGFDVTVVTLPGSLAHPSVIGLSAASASESSIQLLTPEPSPVTTAPERTAIDSALRELTYWRLFRAWYRKHANSVRPDVVFLPYLDYCLHAIALLGSPFSRSAWAGLAMRPSFHYRQMGVVAPNPSFARVKKALFLRLLGNPYLRCFLTIDEPLAEYLANRIGVGDRTAFLPEPAELGELPDPAYAKRQLGVPVGRKVVLVYGAISLRKGVVQLVRALLHPTFPADVDVLLAGANSADVREFLAGSEVRALVAQGRIKVLDRYIATEEEPTVFAAADIVWLGYCHHYAASGVLVQAASAGRPVLACEEGILGWQTKRHGIGLTVPLTNASAVAAAVRSMLAHRSEATARARDGRSALQASFSEAQDILARALVGRALLTGN